VSGYQVVKQRQKPVRQLGNSATWQPGNSATQQLSNPATRQPGNHETLQPRSGKSTPLINRNRPFTGIALPVPAFSP
jgi:hypothetical protein